MKGCHVTRREINERVVTPLGAHLTTNRVEFTLIDFELRDEWSAIEITSPPRSVAPLLNQIAAYTDFEAVLEPMALDLGVLLRRVSDWAGTVVPTRAKTQNVSLNERVAAVVEVTGQPDLLRTLDHFLEGSTPVLRSVTATVRHEKRQFTLSASAAGSCQLTGQFGPDDVSKLRRAAFDAAVRKARQPNG